MPTRTADAIIIHTGEDATLHVPQDVWWFKELKNAFKDGERVTVEVKTRRKPRSLSQNSLFHVYCQEIADETGNDMESVKATLKALYARKPLLDKEGEPIYNKATGEPAEYVQDTRDMSTIEMAELTEKTRVFAMDFLNIVLPLPEEQKQIKF